MPDTLHTERDAEAASPEPHDPAFLPWGTVTPHFWDTGGARPGAPEPEPGGAPASAGTAVPAAGPAATAVPESVRNQLAAITAAAERGDLAAAEERAEALDDEITRAHGEVHPHTIHIREVRAHLAHLAGDPGAATRWYLHVTGLYLVTAGAADPQTRLSAKRAYALWRSIKEAAVQEETREPVAAMLADVLGPSSTPPPRTRGPA
ncbi:hypothetical protein KBZ10_09560 [Streptomyces sp. F63]|uniref:hypothetical protein n=1 Tax=Streptomyces sp. F63 TaxID=2824887 RepID=UPI001B38562D|nr:hypothetical protein [Streptomyces sp. F63]MBQ0984759.1 hypothetical protein [Streptomyces sp. F63]